MARRSTVLIVDSYRDTAEALEAVLELEGFDVDVAPSTGEALASLHDDPRYGLILLDATPSAVEALAFRDGRRDDPAVAGIPVIALAWPRERRPALDADAYLAAPVDPAALVSVVERYCSRHHVA